MDAPDDLVAWWPGDTDGADLVGSHHGALEGTAVAASNGHVGGSFYFDGGGYLEVPDAPALNVGTGHFSLAFWIRTTQGNFGMILGKIHDDNGEVRGYQAWIDFGSIGFELGSQVNVNYASGALINDGLWHFVAITANRTVPDGLTFYVDGVAVGSYDISFLSGSADNPSPLRIGVHSDSLNNYLTGDVDEAQLYKTVLSAEEVEALYEAGTAGVCKVLP